MGKTRKDKMSDYNLQVAWSGKDALADSDPDKVVSGGDFNTEFLAVKTAVNSKADLANTSQVVTAATASAGTNTNQLATTAFVTTAVAANPITAAVVNNLVYPVGSIFTTVSSTAPATLLGMGTWVAFGAGKVPVGIDAGDTDFNNAEETGGAKTHTLSIAELPAHGHPYRLSPSSTPSSGSSGGFMTSSSDSTVGPHNGTASGTSGDQIGAAGSGTAHNNLQPYIVVYMWKRTA